MYELKKIEKLITSKFVGTGPSSYKKRIYRAAASQRLRNTGLRYVRQWGVVQFSTGTRNLFFLLKVQTGCLHHPASYSIGTFGPFPVVKRQGAEGNRSFYCSAAVKNVWTYASTPPYHHNVMPNLTRVSLHILSTVESRMTWCIGYIAGVGIQGLLGTLTCCWIRGTVQTKQQIIF